jgi:sigma-E factor negative regulatory protein RseC
MQHPEGQVLSIDASSDPARAVVEVTAAFRCERCASGKGCGAGLLAGDEAPRRIEALVARQLDLDVGDRVRVELAGNKVLRAAVLVYGLPLGGALLGAGLAWWSGSGDAAAALVATAGALAGIAAGRRRLRRETCLQQFRPVVIARLEAG